VIAKVRTTVYVMRYLNCVCVTWMMGPKTK
jgi:hypothetical protein